MKGLNRSRWAPAGAVAAVALALTLFVTGVVGGEVSLLRSGPLTSVGCYLWWVEGDVVADASAGTAIVTIDPATPESSPFQVALAWPSGVTARRAGFQVAVFDASGRQILVTGKRARIAGGYENNYFAACPTGIEQ